MLKNALGVTVLFLGAMVAEAAPNDVVELALTEVGTGPAEKMKKRFFNLPLMVLGPDSRRAAIERVPASLRQQRITKGRLLRRAERIIERVLRLHERPKSVELFLYQHDRPSAVLWMGCVLIVSDSLVAFLYDAELTGIVAHELAHSYFTDEMLAARKADNERRMKVIELKCDAVAMLSLKLLGGDPTHYVRAVTVVNSKQRDSFQGVRYNAWSRTHPRAVERAVFAERFTKLLD